MQYKVIDCKIKEIYFSANPIIEEEDSVIESRHMFWSTLNNLAVQNFSIQKLRMA